MLEGMHALPDGRQLAYLETGAPGGVPLFFFHGGFGSRLERHPDDSIAERLGVRLITVDRPGHGRSTLIPHDSLLGFAKDIGSLADHLATSTFHVGAWSLGTPFALATACLHADRVASVALGGSMSPPENQPWIRRRVGEFLRFTRLLSVGTIQRDLKGKMADISTFTEKSIQTMCAPDQALARKPEVRAMLERSYAEGTREGLRGTACGIMLALRPWHLPLEKIRMPVHVWVGSEDPVHPPSMSRRLASLLPHVAVREFPGEGHLHLLDHWEEFLRTAIGDVRD